LLGFLTAVSHTRRARFTVTRQKTSALTSEDKAAARHLRCQVPVDNMIKNSSSKKRAEWAMSRIRVVN
jgi:hypothetical protein